ncbi:MAG: GTPase [Nitrososphaerota archaeon]|nr:50S ribosome-binding GTPase [Candidatus Bathyarchaeota archaeon]MDW8048953.1 GTPase [Nitrososphaerota archaeon]
MVTNLPAEAKAKWAEVVAARSPAEKVRLMREFLSLVPKHKGTSKLIANVKHRISVLERELERDRERRRGGSGLDFSVPKEGAGQIIILGPTNVGRSSLLSSLTNAKPEISDIPFTTQKPVVGMLQYCDVQFQLIEAPALVRGAAEGKMHGPQILGLARNADGLIIMVDLSNDPFDQFLTIKSELENVGMIIEKPEGEVEIIRRAANAGIHIIGGGVLVNCTPEEVKRLVQGYGIRSALIRIRGKVSLDDIEGSLFSSNIYKPTLLIANKVDMPGAEEKAEQLKRELGLSIPVLATSCRDGRGLEDIGRNIFQMLRIIRVYAKEPWEKEPSKKPVILEEGTTVIEAARRLHSTLYERFSYARVWGSSVKYPGQKVGPDHILKDGDTIEIH